MQIKQSTANLALVFFMVDSTDHVTGKTGLTPTVTLSKNGGSFASPAGAVTEIANGFYKVAANSTDSNTLGVLALTATATGADRCAMAYEVVANIESDSISAIAALNNLSAAGVRTELSTELARIDAAISSRNATTPPTAAAVASQVRTELSTELARVDVAVSSRNATTPPTAAAIADAVWDEAMSGHATAGTAGSQLTAAGASGDPWASLVPAAYADGTAGAALGRWNNIPADNPLAATPLPPEDPDLCLVYVDTEKITGSVDATLTISLKLETPLPASSASGRLVTNTEVSMTYDTENPGRYTAAVESGLRYSATCTKLWAKPQLFSLAAGAETHDLASA